MRKIFLLGICAAALSGCATHSTESSWSCRAVGNTACASISEIDGGAALTDKRPGKASSTTIMGGKPAAWWDRSMPTSTTREDGPRRESDQTMRIVVASYVDAQGDYHDRATVYAVMRKANWWVITPEPVASQPAPGTDLTPKPAASTPLAASAAAPPPKATLTPNGASSSGSAQ